jgi:AcrR family transcriptional regulator
MSASQPSVAEGGAGVPSRSERRRSRRIDDILRVAAERLAVQGYAATNLDEIAEALDLSKASLYHYFSNKEELVVACLDRVGKETIQRITAVAQSALGPRERLREAIRTQVLILIRDQPAGAWLFLHDLALPPAARSRLRAFVAQHDSVFKSIIDDGIRRGELSPPDPVIARLLMHGAINFVPSWFHQTSRLPAERFANTVADSLLQLFAG